jgi:hypothetical protein
MGKWRITLPGSVCVRRLIVGAAVRPQSASLYPKYRQFFVVVCLLPANLAYQSVCSLRGSCKGCQSHIDVATVIVFAPRAGGADQAIG